MRRPRVPIFPALLLSICTLPWPTHGTPQGMPGTSSKTYLGTGLGYSEAPLHGAQRWRWWWWCVFCQMDEQLLGSQLDRGGWARSPGPPWITRRQLQEKLPALPSELLQWNQGRTKLGEGVSLQFFWGSYDIKFSLVKMSASKPFFILTKNPFYHFILSSKGPDFHLLSNDSFTFSNLRYI